MHRNPVIALAQIRYFDSNKKHNVAKIKKYIKMAKNKKADIICFPESCITKSDYLNFSHELVREIRRSCKENKIWCIVTDSFKIGRKHYKVSLLIGRDGEIKGKYKKINIYDDYVVPGKKIGVFETDFAKIGIVVCWDLAFPQLFYRMKKAGAQIIFCPSIWCYERQVYGNEHRKKELKVLKSMLMSRAFENLYFVSVCNPINGRSDLVSYSAIASPHKILSEISNKEGLITARINLNQIKKFRKIYPNKKD